jgi:hypothetical protein
MGCLEVLLETPREVAVTGSRRPMASIVSC